MNPESGSADRLVSELKVKRYVFRPSGRTRWVVVGRKFEYLVLPNVPYCSCDDYFFRVLHRGKPSCYHIDAVRLARERGMYDEIEEEDAWYNLLMREWTSWEKMID
ncbi:MAG: hypothetical protein NZ920_06235 [Aigarchaeota archaeon]|nr:hypothetical protein [Aigarchaeota archaeon]MDW8092705.1 hypothetical protein [Nitrososphaerota archaeon]